MDSSLDHFLICLQSRVTLCMQRVEDVLDLKFCTDGVQRALQDEDYEKVCSLYFMIHSSMQTHEED